jgi:hypothetical protein
MKTSIINAAMVASHLARETGEWLVWGIDPLSGDAVQFSIPQDRETGEEFFREPWVWGATANTLQNPLQSNACVGGHVKVDLDALETQATISDGEAKVVASRLAQVMRENENLKVAEAAKAVADGKYAYAGAEEFGLAAF